MATTRKRAQLDQAPQRKPKTARERKQDFEKKQRDKGRVAVIVHLSADAKHNLEALRRIGRLTKTGPTTNAEVIESLLTAAATSARIEDAEDAVAAAKPRTRGRRAQRAQTLLNKVDDLLATADLEGQLASLHEAWRYGWSVDVARNVMKRVRAGAGAEDLQWLFYDVIEDYVGSLLEYPFELDEPEAEDRETLAWMRAQLGLRRA